MTLDAAEKLARIRPKEDEFNVYLPGLGEPTQEMGNLEQATRRMVRAMQDIGLIAATEEAYAVLAIEAAREWDRGMNGGNKLSGKAMYLNAVNACFANLPKLEKKLEKEGKTIDDLIQIITDNPNTPTPLS